MKKNLESFIRWCSVSMDMHAQLLSHVQTFVSPRTIACLAPLSMQFSRQEFWSGMKFPTPEDLPDLGIEPASLTSPALAGRSLPLYHLGSPLHWKVDFKPLGHQGNLWHAHLSICWISPGHPTSASATSECIPASEWFGRMDVFIL